MSWLYRFHLAADYLLVPPAALLLGAMGAPGSGAVPPSVLMLSGVLLWTLMEYWMHRILHWKRLPSVRRMHMHHHKFPRELPMGAQFSVPIILGLLGLGFAVPALAWTVEGVYLGYFAYITFHWLLHHNEFTRGPFWWLQERHETHHHTSKEIWFGITSPVWDYVFGTSAPPYESWVRPPQEARAAAPRQKVRGAGSEPVLLDPDHGHTVYDGRFLFRVFK